jgi:hypothetical protein
MDFSFLGFVKDNVYIPPMPVDFQEIRDRIVNTIALLDVNFLDKLWDKLEYYRDVCRITRGSHIEQIFTDKMGGTCTTNGADNETHQHTIRKT